MVSINRALVGINFGKIVQIAEDSSKKAGRPALVWRGLPQVPEPGLLFSWHRALSPMCGREDALAALLAWAAGADGTPPNDVRVRFVTGPGGVGKSRLAAELARELRKRDWIAGFVRLGPPGVLPQDGDGLLLIVDYPEENRAGVIEMLRELSLLERTDVPVRVLLLSRQPPTRWRDEIAAAHAQDVVEAEAVSLEPLDDKAGLELFRSVSSGLADQFDRPAGSVTNCEVMRWLRSDGAVNRLPLFILAAAIHMAVAPAVRLTLSGRAIVRALVERERPRLNQAGESVGLGKHAAARLIALAGIRGGLEPDHIVALADPRFGIGVGVADGHVVDTVRQLFSWTDGRLRPVSHGITAAALLFDVLAERPDRMLAWLNAVCDDHDVEMVDRLARLTHDMRLLRLFDFGGNAVRQALAQVAVRNLQALLARLEQDQGADVAALGLVWFEDYVPEWGCFDYVIATYGDLAGRVAEPRLQIACHTGRARAYLAIGNPQKASLAYQEAIRCASAINDVDAQINLTANIGLIELESGHPAAALGKFHAALAGVSDDNVMLKAKWHLAIGACYEKLGRLDEAIGEYESCLSLAAGVQTDDQDPFRARATALELQANAVANIGNCSDARGDTHAAISRFERAVALARDAGGRRQEAGFCCNLGECHVRRDDLASSFRQFRRALELSREHGFPDLESLAFIGIAEFLINRGKFGWAAQFTRRAAGADDGQDLPFRSYSIALGFEASLLSGRMPNVPDQLADVIGSADPTHVPLILLLSGLSHLLSGADVAAGRDLAAARERASALLESDAQNYGMLDVRCLACLALVFAGKAPVPNSADADHRLARGLNSERGTLLRMRRRLNLIERARAVHRHASASGPPRRTRH